MTKEELESSINTLEILLIIFGIFVAVGVTGESVFGFRLCARTANYATFNLPKIEARNVRSKDLKKNLNRSVWTPQRPLNAQPMLNVKPNKSALPD